MTKSIIKLSVFSLCLFFSSFVNASVIKNNTAVAIFENDADLLKDLVSQIQTR